MYVFHKLEMRNKEINANKILYRVKMTEHRPKAIAGACFR